MNDRIGLKFLLGGMQFFLLVTTRAEAQRVIDAWVTNKLPETLGGFNVFTPPEAGFWAIRTKDISGLHTIDLGNVVGNQSVPTPMIPPRPVSVGPFNPATHYVGIRSN